MSQRLSIERNKIKPNILHHQPKYLKRYERPIYQSQNRMDSENK